MNVTEENSASPPTEAAILRRQSYGRQLGQITDALKVLVDDRAAAGMAPKEALSKFVAMKAEIDKVKAEAATARVDQLCADLRTLKREDRATFDQLRGELYGP